MSSDAAYTPPTTPPTTYIPRLNLAARLQLPTRTAVLLHPRRSPVPSPYASKMGGTIAWPRGAAWPTCVDHGDIVVPILQLRSADIPEMPFPAGKDLFQLLWCPDDHDEDEACIGYGPKTSVFWRVEREIGEVESRTNPPFNMLMLENIPKECVLFPERVVETPRELEDHLMEAVEALLESEGKEDYDAMRVPDGYREGGYDPFFSCAPSTKVGGFPSWIQDGELPSCACGKVMEHLLTVSSGDVGDGVSNYRWAPSDVPRGEDGFFKPVRDSGSGLCVGDVGSVYLYVCKSCEGFPTVCEFMCS